MKFRNRSEAGRMLADVVATQRLRFPIVLAMTPAGMSVAREVAERLNAPLDLFLVHRLGIPGNPAVAMGVVTSGGVSIIDRQMMAHLGFDDSDAQMIILRERSDLTGRERIYRRGHSRLDIYGRNIILVDDELSEGETMMFAIEALRKMGAARVIAAVPVGSREAMRIVREIADDVICLFSPSPFAAASVWYHDFDDVTDDVAVLALDEVRSQARSLNG